MGKLAPVPLGLRFNMADESCRIALVLLCGIPASGKSTLASKLQDYVKKTRGNTMHVIHVCYDDFIPFDLELNEGAVYVSRNDDLVHENSSEQESNTPLFDGANGFLKYSLWKQYRKLVLETVDRALNMIENQHENAFIDDQMVEGFPSVDEFWSIWQKSQKMNCSCFISAECR